MKKLVTLLAIGFMLPTVTMAYQTIEESEFYTEVLKIEQNHGFPIETVKLTYMKHCSQEFANVWMQNIEPGHTNLGVSVKYVRENCSMDVPVWTNESVTVQLNAEVPTTYGFLMDWGQAKPLFSGISVDNFN